MDTLYLILRYIFELVKVGLWFLLVFYVSALIIKHFWYDAIKVIKKPEPSEITFNEAVSITALVFALSLPLLLLLK